MSRPKSTMTWSAARDCLPISKVATVAAEVRACLKIAFGVPPLVGTGPEPPKGGTPNLRLRISVGFFRHALGCRHCRRLREITHFIGVMRRLALLEGCRLRQ